MLRLEKAAVAVDESVPLFPCWEPGRVQTAGQGDIIAEDNTLRFSQGHGSKYSICVCDVPFPDTGVHTIR